jgi:hypothetical protein
VGRSRSVLRALGAVLAVALLLLTGYTVGVYTADSNDSSDGEMIYGEVSEVRASSRIVCIRGRSDVCARLFRGRLPIEGAEVRGWLVALPYDTDAGDEDLLWAFVTVMATR